MKQEKGIFFPLPTIASGNNYIKMLKNKERKKERFEGKIGVFLSHNSELTVSSPGLASQKDSTINLKVHAYPPTQVRLVSFRHL